jgi:putative oxidoreductase
MDNSLNIAARVLMAQLFIISGVGKIAAYGGTMGYFASFGLPMPGVVVALTIIIEVGGGLALLFGLKTRWVAVVLALFTVAAALIAHRNFADPAQVINFTKNLAIAGGLLLFVKYGAGRPAIDGESVAKGL